MGHRLEKNMKIMEELVSFCVKRGCRNIDMNMTFVDKMTTITISAGNSKVSNRDLNFLVEALNSDRQHEVEECYWLVSGEGHFGDELTLAGMMLDSANICYDGNNLKITAKRYEN